MEQVSDAAKGSSGLLMIGAAVVVAGWLLFGLLLGEYAFSAVYIALAALVLLSILSIGGFSLSGRAQRTIGLFMGLAVVFIVLIDLRYNDFPDDFVDVLAYLTFVAGGILMFVGARGIRD